MLIRVPLTLPCSHKVSTMPPEHRIPGDLQCVSRPSATRKVSTRGHFIPAKMAIILKNRIKEVLARIWRNGNTCTPTGVTGKWYSCCGKQYGSS